MNIRAHRILVLLWMIASFSFCAQANDKLVAYGVKAITKRQILLDFKAPKTPFRILSIRACRGEYEPASFVAQTLQEAIVLSIKCADLTGSAGRIPASAVDIRTVKRWYQAGDQIGDGAPVNQNMRLLMPELLLKDDSLIRNDDENKHSYVKLTFPDGKTKWRCVTKAEPTDEENDFSVEACPATDAKTLQPVSIPKKTAKQFWVTVHVPQDTGAGKYEGEIELRSGNEVLETLKLQAEVLEFELAENELESSIYYHWGNGLNKENKGTLSSNLRTESQFRAELENLLAHGVDNPTVGVPFETELLRKELQLRKEVGMKNDHLYYLGAGTDLPLETLKEIISIAKEFGYTDVYFYGEDEASGDALKAQRTKWQKIRKIGGKIFVAGYWDNFAMMGDIQDVMVRCYQPTKQISNLWHAKGHKIFSYGNPQAGLEDPEVYRRNYGLLLAVNGYDGGMDFIYYETWNDFNQGQFRSHNMVYPTVNGVIDTIQWEGYREGIDDLRYLATLKKAIKHAERNGKDKNAEDAKAFINNLRIVGELYWDGAGNTVISPGTDMDTVRNEIIDWIVKLSK
ncbi:hypothetical protein ACFL1G_08520 [Planctomycetota bacterium]